MSGIDGGWLLPETIDPPRRSFCITIPNEPRHVAAFFGTLQSLAEWWNWQRDPEHTATLVAQVWRSVVNSANVAFYDQECQMYLLRQNPSDLCQLQQSVDGGDNWTLAFDFGLCIPPATQTILDQLGTLYGNAWQPSPYAPQNTWVHTDGDTQARSDQRAAALCYAAKLVIGMACDSLVQGYDQLYTLNSLLQAFVGITAPYAVVLGGAVLGSLAVAFMEIALAIVQEMVAADRAIVADTGIRDWLACTLFEQMSSRPVDVLSFAAAFDDDFTCRSADEQRAAELMDHLFSWGESQEKYFQAFSDIVAASLVAEQAGALSSCACPTADWCYYLPLDKWFEWSDPIRSFWQPCLASPTDAGVVGGSLEQVSGNYVWRTGFSTEPGFVGNGAIGRAFSIYVPTQTTVHSITFDTPGNPNWTRKLKINAYDSCAGLPADLNISGTNMVIEFTDAINAPYSLDVLSVLIIGSGVPLFGACSVCP